MDEEELFGRLANSAPSIAPRGDRFRAAIDEVVTESRPPRRPRKRLFVAGATLSVVLLGGTSAALASPPLLEWLGFTPDQSIQHLNANGDSCAAGMIVRPEGVPATDASFLAAKEIFLDIDFDTVKIPDTIRNGSRHSAAAAAAKAESKAASIAEFNAAHPEDPFQPALPDPETDMLIDIAYTLMTDGVESRAWTSATSRSKPAEPVTRRLGDAGRPREPRGGSHPRQRLRSPRLSGTANRSACGCGRCPERDLHHRVEEGW